MTEKEILEMSDEEFEELTWKIAGEHAELPEVEFNPRYMERSDNPTPSGGDYSIAYYYNEDGELCEKDKAYKVNIVEYKTGGIRVNECYASLR